jgi:hypothetical protein
MSLFAGVTMTLFSILTLIQLIGAIVCAVVLRTNLPETVHRVVRKNSRRLDGTKSKRRRIIEHASLDRAFLRVYVGLAIVFAMTTAAGLTVAGISLPLPDMNGVDGIANGPLEVSERPFEDMQWPLVSVYFFSSFLFAPILIKNIYDSAIRHYYTRANLRFMDYYRQESLSHLPRWAPFDKPPRPVTEPADHVSELPRFAPFAKSGSTQR